MIKYYHVKSNGEIAKTPSKHQSFDDGFFSVFYNFNEVSLYDRYKNFISQPHAKFGNLYIGNTKVSLNELQHDIRQHLDIYENKIKDKINELDVKLSELSKEYKALNGEIVFDAFHRDALLAKYKLLYEDKVSLESKSIVRNVKNEYGYISRVQFIINDIKPLKIS